jgi:hypothetical protein
LSSPPITAHILICREERGAAINRATEVGWF